jgi:hypothetical protein
MNLAGQDQKAQGVVMKNNLWIIITLVVTFFGFMIGYSIPPFMEIGFGTSSQQAQAGGQANEQLLKQYEQLYQNNDE